MVTFVIGTDRDDPHTLVIGLSHGNLERLKRGEPIRGNAERTAGKFEGGFLIFSGETEQAMADEVKRWCESRGVSVGADRHGWPGDPEA